ncbi:MAG: hypothetical protein JWM63_4570 [Gammaproteobacteria bacterium]|jgi:transmembrane sensor|nr:hypothetical protein [Gammaproteobacteria bacterium]
MSEIAPRALVEAAAWRTHLAETDSESSTEFELWLAADSHNTAAWKRVQNTWNYFGDQATAPELIMLRRAALTHAHQAGRDRWTRSRRFSSPLGIAIALGAVAIGSVLTWQLRQPDLYQTGAGERRVVTLADGSQITLDSQSKVRVRYSAHARELTLAQGQARFNVAHDVQRPFSVIANGHRVVATGTAFNVDLFGPNLLVTLIEGHVSVLPEATSVGDAAHDRSAREESSPGPGATSAQRTKFIASDARISLDAGEQLVIAPHAPPRIDYVNLERATAWQNGELIFVNEPLSSVVARINRYVRHPVVIDDAATATLRISGVFHTGDVDGFVSTIVAYLPVRTRESQDGTTRLIGR